MLRRIALCASLAAVFGGPVSAQDSPELPKVNILSCEKSCAKWTEPKPKDRHYGIFPGSEEESWGQEGMAESFVLIRFTVSVDGHVKDPVLVRLIGPPAFGKASLNAVSNWEYEPATADGVPVERPNWYAVFTYRVPGATGARPEVYRAFNKAKDLLSESKFSEVDALLVPILSKPRLLFYERAMVSLLLSISHGLQKDYFVARDYAEDANLMNGAFLPPEAREQAIRQRIRLEAATGQYGDALEWCEKLKALNKGKLADDDHEVQLAARINKRLADPQPINVSGYISSNRPLPTWNHVLLRRHFAFPVITGKLNQFQLDCDENKIVSPITSKAEWHVPTSWSNCNLRVEGDPGTTFQLVEANE